MDFQQAASGRLFEDPWIPGAGDPNGRLVEPARDEEHAGVRGPGKLHRPNLQAPDGLRRAGLTKSHVDQEPLDRRGDGAVADLEAHAPFLALVSSTDAVVSAAGISTE